MWVPQKSKNEPQKKTKKKSAKRLIYKIPNKNKTTIPPAAKLDFNWNRLQYVAEMNDRVQKTKTKKKNTKFKLKEIKTVFTIIHLPNYSILWAKLSLSRKKKNKIKSATYWTFQFKKMTQEDFSWQLSISKSAWRQRGKLITSLQSLVMPKIAEAAIWYKNSYRQSELQHLDQKKTTRATCHMDSYIYLICFRIPLRIKNSLLMKLFDIAIQASCGRKDFKIYSHFYFIFCYIRS